MDLTGLNYPEYEIAQRAKRSAEEKRKDYKPKDAREKLLLETIEVEKKWPNPRCAEYTIFRRDTYPEFFDKDSVFYNPD